jgi:sporulation protein YlmC with PRC-barrel domain
MHSTKEEPVMAEAMEFPIGAQVTCTDGVCGELRRVVIDPVARKVTHLVVEAPHRVGLGRLVPVDLVEQGGEELRLKCSQADFEKLDEAEEMQYLPGANPGSGYGPDETWSLPYYGLGGPGTGLGSLGVGSGAGAGAGNSDLPVVYDRIPLGEVEVRRGDVVHASDGTIGKVQGIVIDPEDHQVTHVLLQEGHLWGRKEVAIPINAVSDVKDGIRLSLTKDEVRDLPEVDIDHPVGAASD